MKERFTRLGVPPEYAAHPAHFESVFKGLGWDRQKIAAAIKFDAEWRGTLQELFQSFQTQVAEPRIDTTDISIAETWREKVIERGIDAMPPVESEPASAGPGPPQIH